MELVQEKEEAKNEKGQPAVKAAQLEMLRVVCQRLCDELGEVTDEHRRSDPLMWLLHGCPGTEKSEVSMMMKELFQKVCGSQMGLEYQMVALRAVMAQLLGGDTIQHASGMERDCVGKGCGVLDVLFSVWLLKEVYTRGKQFVHPLVSIALYLLADAMLCLMSGCLRCDLC